jgi:uncharacterized protein YjiS (DUF1127 family)
MTSAWTKYRAYRRTLSELRALPVRSLRDIAVPRDALKSIARRAVYGA